MITINSLTSKDVGRWVTYQTAHGEQCRGRIKSWNDCFVFVCFFADGRWDDYQQFTAMVTNPQQLEFA
jgi:hypothetical protein